MQFNMVAGNQLPLAMFTHSLSGDQQNKGPLILNKDFMLQKDAELTTMERESLCPQKKQSTGKNRGAFLTLTVPGTGVSVAHT